MDRTELINKLIQKYNYRRYLEIGVDSGWCFHQIECFHKDGVDPGSDGQPQGTFKTQISYPVTSDEFFSTYAPSLERYDIILIDGLHHSEQVDRDIQNSLKFLNEGGTVVLHDCNPPNRDSQIVPRIQGYWNGDVWKSIVKFRDNSEMGCIVINEDTGLGIINSKLPQGPSFEFPAELTYEWLEENRSKALHLVSRETGEYLLDILYN
jgi:hypothetical protein